MKCLFVGILIVFAVVACCGDPYPPSNDGMWSFVRDAQEQWTYERDKWFERCQAPAISLLSMKGDCDDFAVMIAYCLQEYWGYDTFISYIRMIDGEDHWVAFLWVSKSLLAEVASNCSGSYPYQTVGVWKRIYIPIDWHLCPEWHWVSPGSSTGRRYEWNELVGKPY